MIKIKFYSFKCNIPYLNIFLNRILVDLDGDSGDFSGDSGDSGGDSGDSGDSAVIPVIPGNRVTPLKWVIQIFVVRTVSYVAMGADILQICSK